MATRQTYVIVVNSDIPGSGLQEILGLLCNHNKHLESVGNSVDASPFIDVKTAFISKKLSGTHSWWDVDRKMDWKIHNVDVVVCTQASRREMGAKWLHHAGMRWIAEQDLGKTVDVVSRVFAKIQDIDIDSEAYLDVAGGARDDAFAVREIFRRTEHCRGHWLNADEVQDVSTPDKKKANTTTKRTKSREERESLRPSFRPSFQPSFR